MDKSQYTLLKKLDKENEFKYDQTNDDFAYLRAQGFFSQRIENGEPIFRISPKGRSEMWDFKLGYYRWWVGVAISVAALIISIIALAK